VPLAWAAGAGTGAISGKLSNDKALAAASQAPAEVASAEPRRDGSRSASAPCRIGLERTCDAGAGRALPASPHGGFADAVGGAPEARDLGPGGAKLGPEPDRLGGSRRAVDQMSREPVVEPVAPVDAVLGVDRCR
jgi:hypothetical protein